MAQKTNHAEDEVVSAADINALGKGVNDLDGAVTSLGERAVYRVASTLDDADLAGALATVPTSWTGLVAVKIAGS